MITSFIPCVIYFLTISHFKHWRIKSRTYGIPPVRLLTARGTNEHTATSLNIPSSEKTVKNKKKHLFLCGLARYSIETAAFKVEERSVSAEKAEIRKGCPHRSGILFGREKGISPAGKGRKYLLSDAKNALIFIRLRQFRLLYV